MSAITREFTKEQLIEQAKISIERYSKAVVGFPRHLNVAMDLELARIALASLEAEPVSEFYHEARWGWYEISEGDKVPERARIPLYRVPPAPASVPDDFDFSRLAFEKWITVNYDSRIMRSGTGYAGRVLNQMWQCWLACRAAMLQGAEPVTTANKLREGVAAIRNSGIAIDAEKIKAERDALNEPTCWCHNCCPVTVTDMRFVVCPDCGNKRCPHANDHRNTCTGSNEPGQEGSAYPAAPQQEAE